MLQPNLRLFRQHGVRGVFEQGNYAPGDEITLTLSRGGQQTDVQITLLERTQ